MSFIPVDYHGVTPIGPEMFPCVLLRWSAKNRVLPIWITAAAADELDIRDSELSPRRPNSYDLLAQSYDELAGGVQEVRIISEHKGVFIANIMLGNGEEIDSRPSDAIIMARMAGLPVLVAEEVLTQTSIFVSSHELAQYFDVVVPEDPTSDSASVPNPQADADFEELMRSLGVSEDDLRGEL